MNKIRRFGFLVTIRNFRRAPVPFWGDGDLDLIQNDLWPSFIESFLWKVNWFKVSQKLVKERILEGNFSCMDLSSNSFTWVNTQVFSISNRNSTFLANTYAINKQREVQFRFRVLLIRNRSSFLDFIDCLLMEKIESQQERYNNINSFKWVWLTELYVRHCKKVEPI